MSKSSIKNNFFGKWLSFSFALYTKQLISFFQESLLDCLCACADKHGWKNVSRSKFGRLCAPHRLISRMAPVMQCNIIWIYNIMNNYLLIVELAGRCIYLIPCIEVSCVNVCQLCFSSSTFSMLSDLISETAEVVSLPVSVILITHSTINSRIQSKQWILLPAVYTCTLIKLWMIWKQSLYTCYIWMDMYGIIFEYLVFKYIIQQTYLWTALFFMKMKSLFLLLSLLLVSCFWASKHSDQLSCRRRRELQTLWKHYHNLSI